jgi:hypothetical protein
MKAWNRADLREVRPWPTGLHFEDGKAERVIDRRMPPRPVLNAIGNSCALRLASRFAEREAALLRFPAVRATITESLGSTGS